MQIWEDWRGKTLDALPSGWTPRLANPSGSAFRVQSESSPLAPARRRLRMVQPSSSARSMLSWDAVGTVANFRIAALMSAAVLSGASGQRGGVCGRGAGSAGSETIYSHNFSTTSSGSGTRANRLVKYVSGTFAEVSAASSGSVEENTFYWMELECNGSSITRRKRSAADPETILDQETSTDASIAAAGWAGLFQFRTDACDVLAVTYADNGDPLLWADPVAATLSEAGGAATGTTTASGSVSTDRNTGTLYAVATTSATAPTIVQVVAGQDHTGAAAAYATSEEVLEEGSQNVSATGLAENTQYFWHFYHLGHGGQESNVATSSGFTTNEAGEPSAKLRVDKLIYTDRTRTTLYSGSGLELIVFDREEPRGIVYQTNSGVISAGVLEIEDDAFGTEDEVFDVVVFGPDFAHRVFPATVVED